MKVLQVIASASEKRGGPSTALRNISTALSLRGIETHIATTDDNGDDYHLPVSLEKMLPLNGVQAIYFRRQTRFYSFSKPLFSWLLQHSHNYDLVHVHGLFNMAPIAAAICAQKAQRPFVLTPHGTLDSWGLSNRRPLLKKVSLSLVESYVLKNASGIHFTSEREAHQARWLRRTHQSTVVPLGIDVAEIAATLPVNRPEGLPAAIGNKPTILFLARIDRMKGLDVLIDAIRLVIDQVTGTQLVIAGDGDRSLVNTLKQRANSLGLQNIVHWLGFVNGDLKTWLLQNSTIFVLPSLTENFGLSVAEAMASSLPVIVAPGVGLAPIVKRGGGLICEAQPAALADAITSLLKQPEALKSIGRQAQITAFDELSLQAFGRRLEELYTSAIADGAANSKIHTGGEYE
jgi:glycosyltransferase involved in cell wall biosynthesis